MNKISEDRLRLAQSIRDACVDAAKRGYESAAVSGLCEAGALEAAIGAIHMLDLPAAIRNADKSKP